MCCFIKSSTSLHVYVHVHLRALTHKYIELSRHHHYHHSKYLVVHHKLMNDLYMHGNTPSLTQLLKWEIHEPTHSLQIHVEELVCFQQLHIE